MNELGANGATRKLALHCNVPTRWAKVRPTQAFDGQDPLKRTAEKDLSEILDAHRPMARLLRAQRLFEALDREIQPALSDLCRGRLRVACVDDETLVLAAPSSAWASRARMEANTALSAARQVWPGKLTQVRVIVAPWSEGEPGG